MVGAAAATAVSRAAEQLLTDMADDLEPARHVNEHLGHVLADPTHAAPQPGQVRGAACILSRRKKGPPP